MGFTSNDLWDFHYTPGDKMIDYQWSSEQEDSNIPDEELIKFYFEHELRLGFVRYIEVIIK